MEKLNLEYSKPTDDVEQWTNTKTGRVAKRRVKYPTYIIEQVYNDEGAPHSFNDEPATIMTYYDGSRAYEWRCRGAQHREGGPASIGRNGEQYWLLHGNPHRENDLPTEIYPNGLEVWRNRYCMLFTTPSRSHVAMRNGVPGYLEEGRIAFTDGSVIRLNCRHEFHNESGEPAIVWADGTKEWYVEGYKCDYL
jgi:hypothetical protein